MKASLSASVGSAVETWSEGRLSVWEDVGQKRTGFIFICQMLPGYSTFLLLDLIFLHVLLLAAGSLNISLPEEVSIIGLEYFYFRHF